MQKWSFLLYNYVMADSYGEFLMYSYLDILLPNMVYIDHYRPDWLKNPNTGYNLELDRYYPELRIGLEYQGELHIVDRHKRQLDGLKYKLANCHGVAIAYIEPIDLMAHKLKQIIRQGMRKSGYLPRKKRQGSFSFLLSPYDEKSLLQLNKKATAYRKTLEKQYGPQMATHKRNSQIRNNNAKK